MRAFFAGKDVGLNDFIVQSLLIKYDARIFGSRAWCDSVGEDHDYDYGIRADLGADFIEELHPPANTIRPAPYANGFYFETDTRTINITQIHSTKWEAWNKAVTMMNSISPITFPKSVRCAMFESIYGIAQLTWRES